MSTQLKEKFAIGSDIGGGHIICAAIDLDNQRILNETYSEARVDSKAEPGVIIDSWSKALNKTLSQINEKYIAGIGIAMPGPFDYKNGIALFDQVQKYERLYGIDIGTEIRNKLSINDKICIRFMNDATCFGIGETWIGKAKDYSRSVVITLGTGFGSAFIENGIPIVERTDVPQRGCVWHLPFRDSIADNYFSTRWYIKRYAEKTGDQAAGVKEIFTLAATDPAARECFVEFGNNLAEFSSPWLKDFNSDLLVIGGNITGAYGLWGNVFEESLLKQDVQTKVLISELKEDAAIIGSARLVEEKFWNSIKGILSKM